MDPQVAELSAIGRFDGLCRTLPWANADRPLSPDDFKGSKGRDMAAQIAEHAITKKVDAVLAPTHLLSGAADEWLKHDLRMCELVRDALDRLDGQKVGIDYPLILPYSVLRERAHRKSFVAELSGAPFDNLWLRTSGFGADATPVGVRRYISGVADLHDLGKSIIADNVGGLVGLCICSFGAVSGVSYGVGEKESFDAGNWSRRAKQGGGGQSGRLLLIGVDRQFKICEIEQIMNARGGRRLLACHDRDCCPLEFDSMLKDPKGHFLLQRDKQYRDVEATPDLRRVTHFLEHHLVSADRSARQAKQLKLSDTSLVMALGRASTRLDGFRAVLEELDKTTGPASTRALPLITREIVVARKAKRGK